MACAGRANWQRIDRMADSAERRRQALAVLSGRIPGIQVTGTRDGTLSPMQRARASAYLREGDSRFQRCMNRGNREVGRRCHVQVTGTDPVVSVADYEEPWHLWCGACNQESRNVGERMPIG